MQAGEHAWPVMSEDAGTRLDRQVAQLGISWGAGAKGAQQPGPNSLLVCYFEQRHPCTGAGSRLSAFEPKPNAKASRSSFLAPGKAVLEGLRDSSV